MVRKIQVFILNETNQTEKTLKTEKEIGEIFFFLNREESLFQQFNFFKHDIKKYELIIINSDSENEFDHWVNIGENTHFNDRFLKAVDLFDGDIFFHIDSSSICDNWIELIKNLEKFHEQNDCGIYSPDIISTQYPSSENDLEEFLINSNVKIVSTIDKNCWSADKLIIDYFNKYCRSFLNENKDGAYINLLLSSISHFKNKSVIRDYNFTVSSDTGSNFNSSILDRSFIKDLDKGIQRIFLATTEIEKKLPYFKEKFLNKVYFSSHGDTGIGPQIDAFIFNWRGQLQKTLKTESELCRIFNKVTVINSDDNNKFDDWVNIGEDAYFSAQFLKALDLFDGDIFFHVQGDVTYDNWPSIIESAKLYYKKYNYGIYAPNVDYTSWSSNRVDISTIPKCNDKKLKLVTMTDCSCWFINKKIIDEYKLKYSLSFKKNKYGFGADLVNCAISIKNNMPVIRDYNYTVNHPKNTNYSSEDAVTMLEEYLKSIKDEKIKFIIEKIRNSELNAIKNINISVKNIPIYCINLKRATERKELMLDEWSNKRGININFFEAFDRQNANINDLPAPYNEKFLNKKTSFEEDKFLYHFLGQDKKMTIGEICCSISHCNLLKKLIDEGVDEAIILEDDAMPLFNSSEDFFESIEACKKENENLNILLLHKPLDTSEGGYELEILESKKNYSILNKFITCTQAIYYSKEGMKKCYESASRLIAPIDLSWQFEVVSQKLLNLINKPLVEHTNLTTYINEDNPLRVFISNEKKIKISSLKKMRVYTAYSQSHEIFKQWFESIYNIYPEIDIKYSLLDQSCQSGEFQSHGWDDVTLNKLKKILEIFDDNSNNDDYFIFSDIDIQFFKPFHQEIENLLQNNDIVFQNDYASGPCTGFFACRKTNIMKQFFNRALEIFHTDDQVTVHNTLKEFPNIKFDLLPKEFFTYGVFNNGEWDYPENNIIDFKIPSDIIFHHANWTIGIDNKLKLLNFVKDNYNNQRFL
jgi:GR25 family glycosyltransferase involved in LPS biosynthesis